MHSPLPKHSFSVFRPLALVGALVLAATGCDSGDEPTPNDGAAWIVDQMQEVRGQTPEEQVRHFEALADELGVATAPANSDMPDLDFSAAAENSESESAPLCTLHDGCISWTAEKGCIQPQLCLVCDNGSWSCVMV